MNDLAMVFDKSSFLLVLTLATDRVVADASAAVDRRMTPVCTVQM